MSRSALRRTWVSAHSAGTSSAGSCMQEHSRLRSWARLDSAAATPPGSAIDVRRSEARRGKPAARRSTAGGGSAHGLSARPRSVSLAGESESSSCSRRQPGRAARARAAAASSPLTSRAKNEAARGPTSAACASLACTQARRCAVVPHLAICPGDGRWEGARIVGTQQRLGPARSSTHMCAMQAHQPSASRARGARAAAQPCCAPPHHLGRIHPHLPPQLCCVRRQQHAPPAAAGQRHGGPARGKWARSRGGGGRPAVWGARVASSGVAGRALSTSTAALLTRRLAPPVTGWTPAVRLAERPG